MKILVTGNQGYIGTELGKQLKEWRSGLFLCGLDTGIFLGCITANGRIGDTCYDVQYNLDVRDIRKEHLEGVDVVVALAAVSNDPIGNNFEIATRDINYEANIRLAELCLKNGVKKYILASSCSIYGDGGNSAKIESDKTNPLTAYARSKIECESYLSTYYSNAEMEFIFLRFSTACGKSDRLRLDLVLNDFVACAVAHKKITVLSDGSPWRPLIDVEEMCKAIAWAIDYEVTANTGKNHLKINIGSNSWNFTVKQLACLVADLVGGCKVQINQDAPADKRSYKVDFSLYKSISGSFYPSKSIETTINELIQVTGSLNLDNVNIRTSYMVRLVHIKKLIDSNTLSSDLRWLNY
ncbi:SDR family oxidoreductase [Synechococcus sp. MIT S1220]|uniref:SDR family oxidoreductase n=1 Tax=Synechococcus sp. MIT S1220 TaxID=3082549 RepID=UPI0039B0FDDB